MALGFRYRHVVALGVAATILGASSARAQQPSPASPPAAAPDAAKLEEAKSLFRQGNELLKAGDWQRALELYVKSRQLVPSVPNTINAGVCLEKLGRFDEALEMYEEVLTKFAAELSDDDRKTIGPAMSSLRRKVGSIDVSANVDGTLVIDGRMRGKLPLLSPVRVLPGKHVVRVMKDGWETSEQTAIVNVGETGTIDAHLKPLANAGRLRVDDAKLSGADLVVDGALVGQLPWEGTLAPGRHWYLARKGDVGSAPRAAVVVQGQTVLAPVDASPLGPDMRAFVEPSTAELSIDGVSVGKGRWQGRLPIGPHSFAASEAGYVAAKADSTVDATRAADVTVRLRVDPKHPRWATSKTTTIWLEALGGPALASSLASDAEGFCGSDTCPDASVALGAMGALRGGFEFPVGVSVEVSGGVLTIGRQLTRVFDRAPPGGTPPLVRYTAQDSMRVWGPFAALGLGYRFALSKELDVGAAAAIGALFAFAKDPIDATASAGGRTAKAVPYPSGDRSAQSAVPIVLPELRLRLHFGSFVTGVGVAAAIFVVPGPTYDATTSLEVIPSSTPCIGVDCVGFDSSINKEHAYGRAVVWLPHLAAGWRF